MGKYSSAFAAAMAEAHRFPEGWDNRERVAVDLGCSPDRVAELMAPLVRAGRAERRDFKIWDGAKISRQTGYRLVPAPAAGGKRAA